MQVSLENVGKLERRLKVSIATADVQSQARARLHALGKTAQIKGFRPGKIPASVLEQRFGATVLNEAMTDAITASLKEALQQQNLRPALAPSITLQSTAGGHIEYTAEFEVMPELGRIEVAALSLFQYVARVGDDDVDLMIESLRQRRRRPPLESAASVDDLAVFAGLGFHEGGMERVRAEIRAGLEHELAVAVAERTKAEVMQQLAAAYADLDVPKGLVEIEMKALIERAQPTTLDASAHPFAHDAEPAAVAQTRVRAFILMTEIARQNSIIPEQGRINATLAEIAAGYDQPEKVVALYASDSELMATLRNRVVEDQTIEWIVAHAKVTEQEVAFNDLVQNPAAEATEG